MMKNTATQRLLQALLAVSLSIGSAYAHSEKTFLMPRPVGMNKAMEHLSWDRTLYDVAQTNKCIHSHLQVTGFYQHSTNSKDTGEYFGIGNCKNCFTVGERWNFEGAPLPVQSGTPLVANPAEVDGALLSGIEGQEQAFAGTVSFRPDQEVWGARIDYRYFHNPLTGWFFDLSLPIVSVTNSMNMCINNDRKVIIAGEGKQDTFTLADFFAGRVKIDDDATTMRAPLCKSKICGKHTKGGLADLNVSLGYRHECHGKSRASANVRLTIPTGNHVRGNNLFEPVVGNGHHVGFGFGLDGGFRAWQCKKGQLWIDAGVQYAYLFEADEVRMLGIKGFTANPKLAHYLLMGTVKGATVGQTNYNFQAIFPAANVLTRPLEVTPGSHIDALLNFSFQTKKCAFDLGYNLYWRSEEDVCVKSWCDNVYGIFGTTLNTNDEVIANDSFLDGKFVNRANLDVCAATTPEQLTHKIYASASHKCVMGACYPVAVSLGGSYEFASRNSALDQYAIWLKAGINW